MTGYSQQKESRGLETGGRCFVTFIRIYSQC